MNATDGAIHPRCPLCGRPLVQIDDGGAGLTGIGDADRHGYGCPAGCRGPEPDGTFDVIECPACGSRDTSAVPVTGGVEEVECCACGAITRLQLPSARP